MKPLSTYQFTFNYACMCGDIDTIRIICKKRKLWDPHRVDLIDGLNLACAHGHLDVVKFLLRSSHSDIQDTYEDTYQECITLACVNNHQAIMEYLFEQTRRPLSKHREPKDILLSYRYLINEMYVSAAVNGACRGGHLELLNCILKMNTPEEDERNDVFKYIASGFYHACRSGHLHIVTMILNLLGNYVETHEYNSGFVVACEFGHIAIVDFFDKLDPPDTVDWAEGIRMACWCDRVEIVHKYIHRINDDDGEIINEFMIAACNSCDLDLVKFFVERGATAFNEGLDCALLKRDGGKIISYLIERGATEFSYAFFVYFSIREESDIEHEFNVSNTILDRLSDQNRQRLLTDFEKVDLYINIVGNDAIVNHVQKALRDENYDVVEFILNYHEFDQHDLTIIISELTLPREFYERAKSVALLLIENGAAFNATLLYDACQHGDLFLVRTLLLRFQKAITKSIINSALHWTLVWSDNRDRINLIHIDPYRLKLVTFLLFMGAQYPQFYHAQFYHAISLLPVLINRRLLKSNPNITDDQKMIILRTDTCCTTFNAMNRFACDDIIIFTCAFMGMTVP